MFKNLQRLAPFLALLFGVLGCGLFSGPGDTELVFAPTEVGTPEGEKVTKEIGPAGGTLASTDGRITLTVPQNALTETIAFSMQPISNKAENGIGLAYRLEPEEMTFTTPLEISVRYDESDLADTIPEALSLGYQDKEGAWHMQDVITLDRENRTITFSATHFSDYSLLFGIRLLPAKATVRVGESVKILVTDCTVARRAIDWIFTKIATDVKCHNGPRHEGDLKLLGEGKLTQVHGVPYMIYTAPQKKPTPNVATVIFYFYELMVRVPVPCPPPAWYNPRKKTVSGPTKCYETVVGPNSLESVITIVDRGYQATGNDGPTSYSGTICSLDKPFTVIGHNGPLIYTDQFTPSSGIAGKATLSAQLGGAKWAGNGPYTVEGIDTENARIVWEVTTTACGGGLCGNGAAPAHIDLLPNDTDECN